MEIEDLNQNHSPQKVNIDPKNQMLSLKSLLIQALNNKDLNLIKFIIHNEKEEIVQSTLLNFTEESYYQKFIQTLFDLLESFPKECRYALKWLQVFISINKHKLKTEQIQLLKDKQEFLLKKASMIKKLQQIQIKSKILQKVSIENQKISQKENFGEPLVFIDETKNQVKNSFIEQYEQQKQNEQEMFFNIPKDEDFEEEEENIMYDNVDKSEDMDEKNELYFEGDENSEDNEDDQEEEDYE